ncbi:colanic acid biosynthesis pyruvyl transferase WcaK [Colwellia sp. RE-S-Sl-9]
MKILLVGNHTCGNRGDGAILRGLCSSLRGIEPNIEIDAITRYPISSSYLIGETLHSDLLYLYHKKRGGRLDRIWKKFSQKLLPKLLFLTLEGWWKGKLPHHIQQHIKDLKKYDAVIQVGGSFFVDLYGCAQFEHALCALIAEKPLYMVGHSVGPFQISEFNALAKAVFGRVNLLSLREPVSLSLMEEARIPVSKVHKGADTAWLVDTSPVYIPRDLLSLVNQAPTVAITLRELAPFDKRLNVSQHDYETAFSQLVDELIAKGYQVVAVSTCTGIDSYHKDDRMVALNVGRKVKSKLGYTVVMDELNDVQLGHFLSYCKLTIGTRLHSAIISMNFNTPAIALNYEHKSEGIMQQLGLSEYSKEIQSLFDGSLSNTINTVLSNVDEKRGGLKPFVDAEKYRAHKMVTSVISDIRDLNK